MANQCPYEPGRCRRSSSDLRSNTAGLSELPSGMFSIGGKTMLAKRVPTILPELTAGESIETTRIYSALGRLPSGQALLARRPYRSPHHTISEAGLVGGGSIPGPGGISMSPNGVPFLDGLPGF